MSKRYIDADAAVSNADARYGEWVLAMAAAEGTRQINMVYKKQELFKAVKKVIESCPSIDLDSLRPAAHWDMEEDAVGDPIVWTCSNCKDSMQMQQQECCCENRSAIQGVNYNLATQSCETRNTVQNTTRDIIDNQNQNARAILDALTAQRIEAKDAKIAEQGQQLFAAQLAASQAAQNETLKAYMSGQLAYYNPRPVPAFQVPAPYQYGNCGTGCGCGSCA